MPCFCEEKNGVVYHLGNKQYEKGDTLSSGDTSNLATFQHHIISLINRPKCCKARNARGVTVFIKSASSEYGIKLLENEMRALSKLRHSYLTPRLINDQLLHSDQDERHLYLIREWADGNSLDNVPHDKNLYEWMEDSMMMYEASLPRDFEKKFIVYLIGILSRLHKYGIYHNDVKPNHFIIGKHWKDIKLVDFGMTQFGELSSSGFKLEGGTPHFSLPPFGLNERPSRRDVYGLCATLYYIFTHSYYPVDTYTLKQLQNQKESKMLLRDYESTVQEEAFARLNSIEDDLKQLVMNGLWLGFGECPKFMNRTFRVPPQTMSELLHSITLK